MDGLHRWLALKEFRIKKIKAIEWKKNPLNYEVSQTAPLLEAAECNTRHGDRLSPGHKKQIARHIATSDPECTWTEEALTQKSGVIQNTVNTWASDIRARQRAGRNIITIRLNRLGWSQEQIAEMVGLTQNRVSEIIGNARYSNRIFLFYIMFYSIDI